MRGDHAPGLAQVRPESEAMPTAARLRDLRQRLRQCQAALSRLKAERNRHLAAKARHNMRDWQVRRRERTRHLIELGGLVVKAGIPDMTDDDRATIYGAFLAVADRLRADDCDDVLARWKRKGKRAFEWEAGGIPKPGGSGE